MSGNGGEEEPVVMDIVTVLQEFMQRTASEFCAIAWEDEDEPIFRWRAAAGNLNIRYHNLVFRSGQDLAGQVWRIGRPVKLDFSTSDFERKRKESPIMMAEQLLAAAAVPISTYGSLQAILLVGSRSLRIYTPDDIQLLMADLTPLDCTN